MKLNFTKEDAERATRQYGDMGAKIAIEIAQDWLTLYEEVIRLEVVLMGYSELVKDKDAEIARLRGALKEIMVKVPPDFEKIFMEHFRDFLS